MLVAERGIHILKGFLEVAQSPDNESLAVVTLSNAEVLVNKPGINNKPNYKIVDVYYATLLTSLTDPEGNVGV